MLSATIGERTAQAIIDLGLGLPVGITSVEHHAIVFSAETLSQEKWNDIQQLNGKAVLAITARRAATLAVYAADGESARLSLPQNATLNWIKTVANPATDLDYPMKGPFTVETTGDPVASKAALLLCKTAQLLPAALLVTLPKDIYFELIKTHRILDFKADELLAQHDIGLEAVSAATLPLEGQAETRLNIFRSTEGTAEHYALEYGKPDRTHPVLVRLHSACFTGDVLGSLKCDCGPQLHAAMTMLSNQKEGVLLYLNQEGRGIGLANKMRAYSLQDQGYDTVEANHRLGFEDDERDFRIGARILKEMGISSVRLMTNNPKKVDMLEKAGIAVAERIPLIVGKSDHNKDYLSIKAQKSGHFL